MIRFDILAQFFTEGSLGALIGCGNGVMLAFIALRVVDARVQQPFLFSSAAAFLETIVLMTLYAAFTLISSLRAIDIQPLVALRSE